MAGNTSLLESNMLLGLLEDLDPQGPEQREAPGGTFEGSPAQGGPYAVVGPSTEELESLKELIRFDHEYVKKPPVPTATVDIKQEKISYQAAKPDTQESVRPMDLEDDSVIDFSTGDYPASVEEFKTDVFREKAEAALQDMLVSLKDASLSVNNKDTTVPNLLSIDDGIFDCDLSDLLSLDSDIKSCDSKSEAGHSEDGSCVDSAFSDTPGSPFSDDMDMSPNLGDSIWEESFTHLFPSLDDF